MYIVIECFPGPEWAAIVQDSDSGKNVIFSTLNDAEAEAEKCQDGKVVEV